MSSNFASINYKNQKKTFQYFVVFLLFFLNRSLTAQSPYFHQISNKEGLPSMTVYDIHESKSGYIWLGTDAGICRYDGVRFKNFPVTSSYEKSFTKIQEDKAGNIYFTNFAGQLFCIKGHNTLEVELPPNVQKTGVRYYLIDHKDNLWIPSDQLYLKKKNSEKWTVFDIGNTERPTFKQIQEDIEGNIWVLSLKKIFKIKSDYSLELKINAPEDLLYMVLFNDEVISFTSHNTNFYSYNLLQKTWRKIFKPVKEKLTYRLITSAIDKDNSFWILSQNGMLNYDYIRKEITHQKILLEGVLVSDFLQDREGNRWFTTIGKGVFILLNKETLHFNSSNSSLAHEQLNCITPDNFGNFYIGTNGNHLFYLDTKTKDIKPIFGLPTGDVECLLFDSNTKKLYVENGSIYVYDTSTGRKNLTFTLGNTPKALAIYQNDYLISVAGDKSLIAVLDTSKTLTQLIIENTTPQPSANNNKVRVLRSKRGRALCVENTQKRFWIAYSDGLFYYENTKGQELRTEKNEPIICLSLSQDEEGVLWAGTAKQGIFAIKEKRITAHLKEENGLISKYGKVKKDKDFLYIGTKKGLQIYHLKTGNSRVFNDKDGLPSNEINDLLIQEDKIYLATNAGLSILNKDFNSTNKIPPVIYVTSFAVGETPQTLEKKYELPYSNNNIKIEFTALSFRSLGNFRCKYRLLGLNNEWIETNATNNFARYPSLPPGKFEFEVKAINEDDIESEETASIKINIAPPFWQTWWFISLAILSGTAFISLIFLNRIRAIQYKNKLEKDLQQANLAALKAQMNPHFIFNVMTAIQNYMIRTETKQAGFYLSKFSKLIRRVLEDSRNEYVLLVDEIEMLEDYLSLHNLLLDKTLAYQIITDEKIIVSEIAIPSMFAQPIIENAIKHGVFQLEKGSISIDFKQEKEYVILEIFDNGIGVNHKQRIETKHEPLATKITEERIEIFRRITGKDIKFEIKSTSLGTHVVFHLPYVEI